MFNYNVNIPSNIGSAGNVSFDSAPYVKYALETQARNRAKEEAFVKSFQNMAAQITPAGMASNDIPDFMKMKQDWMNYIIKNKNGYENPENDGGQAYGQAMTKYNQILSHVQNSKDKVKRLGSLNPLLQNPDRRALLSEQTLMDYGNGSLPVNDPNYQPFDMSSVDFNPKPFDQAMQNRFYQGIDKNIKREKVYGQPTIDAATHSKITPYAETISKDSLPLIRNYAATLSGTSTSAANFFDSELNNPDDYARLNEVFKQAFPKDGNISNREDMATAWTLSQLQLKHEGQEKSPYTPPRPKAAGTSKATTSAENQANIVNSIADAAQSRDNTALQVAAGNLFKGNGGEKFKAAGVDDRTGNLIIYTTQTVKGKKVEKTEVYSPNDNTFRDKLAGKVQSVMGANAKLENYNYSNDTPKASMPKTQSSYKASNGKNYTHAELLKMGYDEEAIKQAIKLGNLK